MAGYSGIGKTSLVHEIYKPVTGKRGNFIEGKFDQYQRNIPYFVWGQAFNGLMNYLLMENDVQLAAWKAKILKAVGPNGKVLTDVIPNLERIIGTQPGVPELGAVKEQNRFNYVFQKFVKTMAQKEHPLIIFLDDLQWIDAASLNLFKVLLTDPELAYFQIIGAYRDNEVDVTHPLMIGVAELQKENVNLERLPLVNISESDVNALSADTLHCSISESWSLAQLVYTKTAGNAFFTHQILHSLNEKNLLTFDASARRWQWDMVKLQGIDITDNVVALMESKVRGLPIATQEVLKLAACVGYQIDLVTLTIVAQKSKEVIRSDLRAALREGILYALNDHYKFAHDQIQQVAYAIVDSDQQQTVHLEIGRLLLKHSKHEALEVELFDIVTQMNSGFDLIDNQSEKNELARLNLKAAQKAKLAAAYGAAFKFLSAGLKCLAENCWQKEYNLPLSLYSEMTQVAFLTGNIEQMEHASDTLLKEAKKLSDKVKVYEVLVQSYITKNRQLDIIHLILNVLSEINIKFPVPLEMGDISDGLKNTESLLAGKQIMDLTKLPEMTCSTMLAAMRLMNSIVPASYQSMPLLFPLLTFKQVELSIKYGNCSISALSYVCYGIILTSMNDINKAVQFGQLSLLVYKHFQKKEIQTSVMHLVNGFLCHWTESIKSIIPRLRTGFQNGLDTGDFEYAGYAAVFVSFYQLMAGMELSETEVNIKSYSNKLKGMGLETSHNLNEAIRQVVLNLTTVSRSPLLLSGDAYDIHKMIPLHLDAKDHYTLAHIYFFKLFLCYLFEQYYEAIENADKAKEHFQGVTSLLIIPVFNFFDSLTHLAMYNNTSIKEQKQILKRVNKNQESMLVWAQFAPTNSKHKYDLVEAERARIKGDRPRAMDFYEQAIKGAKINGFIQEEALAYELAAKFYLNDGKNEFAKLYMQYAHKYYLKWQAYAKVKHLEEHYPQWFSSTEKMAEKSSPFEADQTKLDLNTVTKASQTIAVEIVLEKLITKMMQIVIENAGAQKGFLILERENKWVIEAEGDIDKSTVVVMKSVSIGKSEAVPEGIIQYVIHSQENIVLGDAANEGDFINDATIQQNQSKSVLCTPLINQGRVSGILYLENNLTTSAFTPERVELLNLLSSQMAVALDNARLYTNLEERVEQRTEELNEVKEDVETAKQQLEYVFDATKDGIWDWNIVTDQVMCSPQFLQMLGYTSDDFPEKTGEKLWLNLLHPDDKETAFRAAERHFSSGEPYANEQRIHCKDGSYKWILSRGKVVSRDTEGNPIRMIGSHVDIDPFKTLQKQLQESKEKAEAANQAKSIFLANMSHEIRTPMNAILGFTEILSGKELGPENLRFLELIHTSGNALLNLINDILDLSKVEAGKLELQYSPVSVKNLFKEMKTIFNQRISDKGLDFIIEIGEDIFEALLLDENRLRQILVNLISNSVKFTENGYISLNASSHPSVPENSSRVDLTIEVRDTGIGIAKDQQDKIFDAFEQVKDQKKF